ncbi:MAG: hypothetical protein ABIY56_11760, partial [Dokdonella sp.]
MSGMDRLLVGAAMDAEPRGWRDRSRALFVALSGAGMLWLSVHLLNLSGMFVVPMELHNTWAFNVPAQHGSIEPLLAAMQQHPGVTVTATSMAVYAETTNDPQAQGQCDDNAVILETLVRVPLLSYGAVMRKLEAEAPRLGYWECRGRTGRTGSGQTGILGPLIGAALMSGWLLLVLLRARSRPDVARRWVNWVPRVQSAPAALVWGLAAGTLLLLSMALLQWIALQLGMAAYAPVATPPRRELLLLAPLAILAAPLVEEYIFRAWLLERGRLAIGAVPMLL